MQLLFLLRNLFDHYDEFRRKSLTDSEILHDKLDDELAEVVKPEADVLNLNMEDDSDDDESDSSTE